ncbi:hypothetical protein HaLaN_24025, partial [Haematococcus lacustris]
MVHPVVGVSRMLARMLQQMFPAEYAARLAAVAEEQKQAAALLDLEIEQQLQKHLVRHLYAKKPHMSEPLRKSLPEFVRGMEARLYQAASSREAYLDLSTLDARVTLMAKQQLMANRMARMAVGGMPAQPALGAAAPA